MKRFIKNICAALLVCAAFFATDAFAQDNAKQNKPAVMILGSYHMGNPGLDLNNVKADDVRVPKRQKEIADFIEVLKKFKPTRIAVEIAPDETKYLESYRAYLDGKYELKANEIDQIGFRLGKELDHRQLYPIDWHNDFDYDKVLASAKTNGQEPITDALKVWGKNKTDQMNEQMKTATITELYRDINDEKNLDAMHQPYLTFVRVGAGKDFAGANLTRDWYERNLKIYANITRLAAAPNERVLVIIGAGHAKLLQQFVGESGDFELVRLNKYL